jgi:hypothetical protein
MLSVKYVNDQLKNIVVPLEEFAPFPSSDKRESWESLSDSLRKERITEGEKYLNYEWPALPAARFMNFVRNGNRTSYERPSFQRRTALASLVVAECMEGKSRFIDDIINGIWCICEESFWGVSAHNYISKKGKALLPDVSEPIIDLFAGETAGLLSLTHHLLKSRLDKVSPLICERIQLEMKRRILDPYLERDDFWWMGLATDRKVNNWNPWCNSNCLIAFLLIEDNPERRIQAVAKALRSLDRFIDVYHDDGGCDEGTMYWGRAGGSLFDCLELLYSGTDGKINVYEEPLIKEIGRYLYRSYIDEEYFINFADGGAKVKIFADLVYRYGRRIGDNELMALGSSAFHLQRKKGRENHLNSLYRQLPELFNFEEITAASPEPPFVRDSWLKDIQVMAARQREGTSKGLYLAAKGGHNDESHNHNDIGQFIVYADGRPFLIDAGVETYTRETFGPNRYDIWTMQSAYHNLPTINGVQQKPGNDYKATQVEYKADEVQVKLSLNIASAFPTEAGIDAWKRRFEFNRSDHPYIEITDEFQLEQDSENITLSLMMPFEPQIDRSGSILIRNADAKAVKVEYDADHLVASSERILIEDERLRPVWGDQIYRVTLKANAPVSEGNWKIKVHQV